jgi:hypothetical protein
MGKIKKTNSRKKIKIKQIAIKNRDQILKKKYLMLRDEIKKKSIKKMIQIKNSNQKNKIQN